MIWKWQVLWLLFMTFSGIYGSHLIDDTNYNHLFGNCPENGDWEEAPFMCYMEGEKELAFEDAVLSSVRLSAKYSPYANLMPLGKIRKFDRMWEFHSHMFKNIGWYRINAYKGEDWVWREWPSGKEVPFHHFPKFDPDWGRPGDTLLWRPKNLLKIASKEDKIRPLYYMPKLDVCQRCPGYDNDNECNDAGDCWRGKCACDDYYDGFKCQDGPMPLRQLVVIGGAVLSDPPAIVDEVQIVGIGCPDAVCDSIASLPSPLQAAVAEWVDDHLMVCGGYGEGPVKARNVCYVFDSHDQEWKLAVDMHSKRIAAGSVMLPNGDFWVTGGYESETRVHDSSEILRHDRMWQWKVGPILPRKVSGHCMVAISDCEVAIIGGLAQGQPIVNIDIYNLDTQTWREGPDLIYPRGFHGCVKLREPRSDHWTVLIAGGVEASNVMHYSIESWDIVTNQVTELELELPEELIQFQLKQIDDYQALIIGGISDDPPESLADLWSISYETGLRLQGHLDSPVGAAMATLTRKRYFHCDYPENTLNFGD